MTEAEAPILIERHDGWVQLTLNRPARLNAFNEAMHRDLAVALEDIHQDDLVRAVLLTGAGRGFCAGQDLSERRPGPDGTPPDLGATLDAFYNPLVRKIRDLAKPVVCAVNGVAAGAGANVALACDIVLAGHSARFIQSFAAIGLVPDAGGSYFLPRLVGDARARALMMLAEPVSGTQAAEWGMIWRAVDDATLMAEAQALAARLARAPTQSLAMIKNALAHSATNTLREQLKVERDLQRHAGLTPDYAEGVRAFLEKRAPAFTGKAP